MQGGEPIPLPNTNNSTTFKMFYLCVGGLKISALKKKPLFCNMKDENALNRPVQMNNSTVTHTPHHCQAAHAFLLFGISARRRKHHPRYRLISLRAGKRAPAEGVNSPAPTFVQH